MDIRDRRLAIFKRVENGEITLDEAARVLEALERFGVQAEPAPASAGARACK